ncbi:MAG TPA: outer membrane beta-barrel protein [Deltaproteobacteria bacterium]|jgi:long-chain fatty acid transport protein|nr:outer membrane beta-barrel protein [Deltaproteobacteria bacterium]HNQ86591.1 outer membrane beta-barrel protein [Deltaproteobacteria bacterium]HOC76826.1 outer membrane beta-barrel protein [Deltaproteobacteria bacterium]HOY75919.1 outer membrane beta-barrel protein [Deltaproteobacteria bacterium]HPA76642.1 outer membrane beta-barrel protein [Deltaproteobacteria bacterium]
MNFRRIVLSVWLFSTVFVSAAFAQIDNLTNMSAEWIRLSNRNAATDATDIVIFNPAGTTSLSEGFHIGIGNQFLFRMPEHSFTDPLGTGPVSYEQDSPDLFVPNVCTAYTSDKWSLFAGVHIPGGGATLDYPDGSYTTRLIGAGLIGPGGPYEGVYTAITNESLEAESLYLAATLGGAYKVTDKVSVAVGIRYIDARNTIDGKLTMSGGVAGEATPDVPLRVDVDQDANGWGGILGVQVAPTDKLNLTMRYETTVKLDFEDDVNTDDIGLYLDGEKNRRDFPAMIGLGASYQLDPKLRCEVDFNWFFQKSADWGENDDGSDNSNDAGDVWSIGAAAAYQATTELEVSAGFLYTKHDWADLDAYYNNNLGAVEVLYSTNVNLSTGFAYKITPDVKLNCGVSYTFWDDEDINTPIGVVSTENDTFLIGLGVDVAIPAH